MPSTETYSVDIAVRTQYLPAQSSPDEPSYAFAYTITITNSSVENIQLLSRHWIITDSDENIQEVRGEGVVGEQPILAPGKSFVYTSGSVIKTPVGTMQGSYFFITGGDIPFETPIPPFRLAVPNIVN